MGKGYQNRAKRSTLGGSMLNHSAAPTAPRFFSRRAATVGAEIVDDKPVATLGETLVFLIPAFIAGLLLVGTLGMVGKARSDA
jgi:hypothetical protein